MPPASLQGHLKQRGRGTQKLTESFSAIRSSEQTSGGSSLPDSRLAEIRTNCRCPQLEREQPERLFAPSALRGLEQPRDDPGA